MAKTILTLKVKKEIHVTLTPEIEKMIKRWGNRERRPDQFIFPYLKGKETFMEISVKAQDIFHITHDMSKENWTKIKHP